MKSTAASTIPSGHQTIAICNVWSPAAALWIVRLFGLPSRAGNTLGYRPAAIVVSIPTMNRQEPANARSPVAPPLVDPRPDHRCDRQQREDQPPRVVGQVREH
jgi:hypothetical protein